MSTVKDILDDRQKTHGNYSDIVECRAEMLRSLTVVYKLNNGISIEPPYRLVIMWNDILLKLARSAANPDHEDSWDDLMGYATIIQEIMGTQKEEDDDNS